ncbi:MAG: hypothetical protein OXG11_11510 [Chloroflexi bacterium]|nr:hypothetical protein [Chloroflexota bacterium]
MSGPANSVELRAVPPFNLAQVVRSHGWIALPPFRWDEPSKTLITACELEGRPVMVSVRETKPNTVAATWTSLAVESSVPEVVNRMLGLSEDLSAFQQKCGRRKRFRHIAERGLGRLLRSPTLWEDAVKVLCTTNISWAGTRGMVQRLVDEFGAEAPGGVRCFPSPAVIADAGGQALAERAKLGYRAPHLAEFASAVSDKRVDLPKWEDQRVDSNEVRREILAVKGFGEYAAATIMALTGRYDRVPIDTAYMDFVTRRYFGGSRPSRKAAEAAYESWGEWKHLAYWFERFAD